MSVPLKGICRKLAGVAGAFMGLMPFLGAFVSDSAFALPAFARQTGQNCVACHAGGQFPELTPYGRMFKMTGYTIGERQAVPLSMMINADYARIKNTADPTPQDTYAKNGVAAVGGGSLFVAGKITDNIGGFIQDTFNNYSGRNASDNTWFGHSAADYVDLRYADRLVDNTRDLVFGVSLNNRPSGTDPSSAAPAWMQYVPGTNVTSRTVGNDAAAGYPAIPQNVAGLNAYLFWNRMVYAELGAYQTANRWKSFLTSGTPDASTPKVAGTAPYWRLAFSHEWGAHNVLVGTTGMVARYFDSNSDTSNPRTVNRVKNLGVDAQYQYLLDPHTVTGQLSFMKTSTRYSDAAVAANADGWLSDTSNTLRAKGSYIYQAKYGGSLSYFNRFGTSRANAIAVINPGGNLDTNGFTYEAFVTPVQYIRVGVQYTTYNKFAGLGSNYNGTGRNPSDNNTLYFYVWGAY